MVIVSVMYPKTRESHFDLDYYLQKHIPFVKENLEAMGLEDIRLMRGSAALDGTTPLFELIGELVFTSVKQLQEALGKHGEKIVADIANFTNVQRVIQINETL